MRIEERERAGQKILTQPASEANRFYSLNTTQIFNILFSPQNTQHIAHLMVSILLWYTVNVVNISVFNDLSIGGSLVAVV